VTGAPIAALVPLTRRPAPQLIEELAKAGILLPSVEASIESVVGDDRALQGKAIGVLFRKR
jgi:hypothetical protein